MMSHLNTAQPRELHFITLNHTMDAEGNCNTVGNGPEMAGKSIARLLPEYATCNISLVTGILALTRTVLDSIICVHCFGILG
jgi:hypothetical protein